MPPRRKDFVYRLRRARAPALGCKLKDKLGRGEVALGTWVTVGHPDVPDMLEALGFDWLVFDTEHAPIGPAELAPMIQAVDADAVCPLVRVGGSEQFMVKSALDMGAHGVLFPLVGSAEEARAAVRYVKYPPAGVRGVAPRKAANYGLDFARYIREANSLTVVAVQVETEEAVRKIDEIAAVDGVDIAFVGPTDLTASMGLLDDRGNQRVLDAMKKVIDSCKRSGKSAGVLAATPQEAERDIEMGFQFVGLGSDTRFLAGGAKLFLDAAKKGRQSG